MKKIAIIVQRYGQEVSGGGEFYAKALAEHLKERYDVTVLTTTSLEYMDWDQYYPSGEGEVYACCASGIRRGVIGQNFRPFRMNYAKPSAPVDKQAQKKIWNGRMQKAHIAQTL